MARITIMDVSSDVGWAKNGTGVANCFRTFMARRYRQNSHRGTRFDRPPLYTTNVRADHVATNHPVTS